MQAAAPDSHADALQRIRALLGRAGCIDEPALAARFLTDFRGLYQGATPFVACPATTTEVAQLLALCNEARIAVVPQDVPHGFPYTVEQLVLMGRFPHAPARFFESREDLRIAREAMALTGIESLAAEPLEHLSGGERQRVVLARALAQQPRLLVLDEPTAHLDLRYQAECVALLRRLHRDEGLGILLVSHDLNLAAEVSDRLLLLAGGSAVKVGPPEEVLEETVLEAVYGCRVMVDKHPATRRPTVNVLWPDGR